MWSHGIHLMNSVYGLKGKLHDEYDDGDYAIYRETAQKDHRAFKQVKT